MNRILLFLTVVLFCAASSGAMASDEEATPEHTALLILHGTNCLVPGLAPPPESIASDKIHKCLELDCLSSKNARVIFNIGMNADAKFSGIPIVKFSSSRDADERDIFYCEQAIWEVAPFPQKMKWYVCGFDSGFAGSQSKELYCEDRAFVRMHLIPVSACERFPDAIMLAEVQNSQNVVKIACSLLTSSELKQFRTDWAQFFKLHDGEKLSKKELQKQAATMKSRYLDLFGGVSGKNAH